MPCLFAQDAPIPLIDGYVSQLTSQTSFAVDGRRVNIDERTNQDCYNLGSYRPASGVHPLALGDHLLVFGKYERSKNLVRANAVCKVQWGDEKVSGEGVVEAIDGQRLVVDGRLLDFTPAKRKQANRAEGRPGRCAGQRLGALLGDATARHRALSGALDHA
jgi:hypothetical protein